MRQLLTFAVCTVTLAACEGGSAGQNRATWTTVFDSTGDTIVAHTTGDVPNEAERRLVLEQRIGEAEGNDSVTFGQILYVAVTDDNRVFVFDRQGPIIKLFDSAGTFVRFVGRNGSGPGEFEQVNGMDVLPNGGLALWDASHARVNIYDGRGDFTGEWRVPGGGFFTSHALRAERSGNIVLRTVVERAPGKLGGVSGYIRYDVSGNVRDTIRVPRWIDSTPQIVASRGNPAQVSVSLSLPYAPQVIDIWSKDGALVSGPSAPYVTYITSGPGRPIKVARDFQPVPVKPEERAERREMVIWQMRTSIPDWSWSGPDMPITKPAYSNILGAEDGGIWIAIHSDAERVATPDSTSSPPGLPQRPIQHYREPNVYDVFDATGAYLGRVRTSASEQVLRARSHQVWGVLTDSLGIPFLARWRIEPPFPGPQSARARPLN